MLKELENMTYEEALEEFSVQSFSSKKKKKDCRDGGGVEFNLFTAENLKGQLFVLICRLRKSKKSTLRKRKLNFKS